MSKRNLPKVSFGIIVLNGEPFTRYCLRALYPFAHESIVVEGACQAASAIATADDHSTDGTPGEIPSISNRRGPQGESSNYYSRGFLEQEG